MAVGRSMNTQLSDTKPSVWADLASVVLPLVLFAVAVFLGLRIGLIPRLSGADWVVLIAVAVSISLTNIFGFYAAMRAEVHRLGFQLSTLSLGTCLSLLAA